MREFKIIIKECIFKTFPDLEVHALMISQTNTLNRSKESDTHYTYPPSIPDTPILKEWQKIYKSINAPRSAKPSIAYLIWAASKGKLKHISKLVDLYNKVSLETLCPLGGEDMDAIDGGLCLQRAQGQEYFIPLNQDTTEHPKPGEMVWASLSGKIVSRCINWKESEIFKITQNTKNAIFISERPTQLLPNPMPALVKLASAIKSESPAAVAEFTSLSSFSQTKVFNLA